MADPAKASHGEVYLSIVIPAYNEEHRLPATLSALREHLAGRQYSSEVIVVENGSADRTLPVVQEAARAWPGLRWLTEPRRGKGLAVRRGMLAALGRFRFMCDADLSMPLSELHKFLPPALGDFDVAIGARAAAESVVIEPYWRRRIGFAFNALVRWLVLPGIHDTQCGFKCFRAEAAELIFRRTRLDGMAFDVEALVIAAAHGLRIVPVPITWRHDRDSRVRLMRDAVSMASDLLAIRRNVRRGLYG